ncbi:Restriction endonuclease [Nitrosospira multiformis]|uniref:Restriction endonuclease n=1 Tax=Nitrosospira multiformis TaxID=1231 RepID=A0A1H8IZX5_9PROT|nr:restriction endonuclease [Nitrosospira multiformis]SEN73278.1 Restriction endonuclease [Nitrosospira multiformis]
MTVYSGKELITIDLIVDAVYKGFKTDKGGMSDPLVRLVGVSRQGGFRYRGTRDRPTLLVLTSNLAELDWPDELDSVSGRFVYYGDNRQPGQQLHDTPRFGNLLLKNIFELAHSGRRKEVPPILIFTSESPGRSFRFRGLAVPGHPAMPPTEDLVAVWKTANAERFQNYRAVFTILDVAVISRDWVHATGSGVPSSVQAPVEWRAWVENGVAKPLEAPRTHLIRTKAEQLPANDNDMDLIRVIKDRYKNNAFGFEACAGALAKLLLGKVTKLDLTRPWRDGGRDGVGMLQLGRGAASIEAAFALEAKCYGSANSVGVREVSRLISRIKHREFGVLVTTAFIDRQAYQEVVDDGHPVIFVVAMDIVRLLREAGYSSPTLVSQWLDTFLEVDNSARNERSNGWEREVQGCKIANDDTLPLRIGPDEPSL